jgi:hypothetical protein
MQKCSHIHTYTQSELIALRELRHQERTESDALSERLRNELTELYAQLENLTSDKKILTREKDVLARALSDLRAPENCARKEARIFAGDLTTLSRPDVGARARVTNSFKVDVSVRNRENNNCDVIRDGKMDSGCVMNGNNNAGNNHDNAGNNVAENEDVCVVSYHHDNGSGSISSSRRLTDHSDNREVVAHNTPPHHHVTNSDTPRTLAVSARENCREDPVPGYRKPGMEVPGYSTPEKVSRGEEETRESVGVLVRELHDMVSTCMYSYVCVACVCLHVCMSMTW